VTTLHEMGYRTHAPTDLILPRGGDREMSTALGFDKQEFCNVMY
jgi:hypothetical protein